jgi:hypothetical protein
MYADRCNKDTPLSDAENLMSKFSSTDKWTQYTFTNTAYENSGKDYGYTYTISVIPNVFGYQSLQAAKKELWLFSCWADAYVLTQVNNKYIVIDGKGCKALKTSHNEWCEQIYTNIIQNIKLK